MKINQEDLAQRLGISRTTVSRSFSNHPAINPETRARVMALAEELGYRYSVPRSGRARDRLRTSTVGVLIGTPQHGSETAETSQAMLRGISERAAADRISLDVTYVDPVHLDLSGRNCMVFQRIRTGHWNGMILIYPFERAAVGILSKRLMAVSVVEDYGEFGIDCIDTDQAAGIFNLIQHLNLLGHRRIGFLTWRYPIETPWAYRRFGAYAESLLRLDLTYRPEWAVNIRPSDRLGDVEAAERVARLIREEGVTAWVCAADHQAYRLIAALETYGLRVPEDCSVTGFDGIKPPSGSMRLTTVKVPYEDMGVSALIRLRGRIEHPAAPRRHNLVAGRTIAGQTTAPPPPRKTGTKSVDY
jgi:LacI family transcriptional regulator